MIKGCVCWTPSSSREEEETLSRLELELLGYEKVMVKETESYPDPNGIRHPATRQRTEKEILIKFPYTLYTCSSAAHKEKEQTNEQKEEEEQSYEYPFEWELPSFLPSSFHFATTHQTFEITYQMTAKAVSTRGKVFLQNTVSLHIQAADDLPPGKAIVLKPQKVNLLTNVVFPRGALHWGWSTPSDVVTTGSTVEITISGENRSQVDLKDFVVRLVETIVYSLTSASIEVNRQRQWLSGNPGQVMAPPTQVALIIPDDTRETYASGTVLRIEHSIVVIAQTATDRTTNPRLSHPVYIVRRDDSE